MNRPVTPSLWPDELEPRPSGADALDVTWLHVGSHALPVCVLSEQPVSYEGHWVSGAMRPCSRSMTCRYCASRIGRQSRLVLCAYDLRLRAPGILEVGILTAQEIKRLAADAGHLRGLRLYLYREAERARGRIIAGVCDSTHPANPDPLPKPHDTAAVLARTWARQERDHPTT